MVTSDEIIVEVKMVPRSAIGEYFEIGYFQPIISTLQQIYSASGGK